MARSGAKGVIQTESLRKEAALMLGRKDYLCDAWCEGHRTHTKQPMIIFDLKEMKERRS